MAESAYLIGIPQRPSMSEERALQRQEIVLRQMAKLGNISEEELQEALEEELVFSQGSSESNSQTRYFVDTVIYRELADLWSKDAELDLLYQGGLKIYTTLDYDMQAAAEKAFAKMPAVSRVDENGVQQPQGGLVAIDPATGHVKAMIGGRDYKETQFNRAVDARRSPGSAFKPFVYAAALEQKGYTAATQIVCEPVTINIPGAAPYEPRDYGGSFHNKALTLREALAVSCNVSAIKTNMAVGPEQVAAFAARMGIKSPLEPVVSLPLGSSDVNVLEMVTAYTPFANKGIKVEPLLVTRVEDSKGNVLLENQTRQDAVLDEGIAFIITDVLKDVLQTGGTATSTAALKDRPAAGKTGTAQNEKSVYMIGYTPDLVAAVYVGDDDQNYSLAKGSTGAQTAAPVWAAFMAEALKDLPPREFELPANVVQKEICPETGLLANPACTHESYFEYFIEGTEPTEACGPENCSGCQNQWWWPWNPFFWRN